MPFGLLAGNKNMNWYTYVLYSKNLNKFYIGSTNDLERRLKEHRRGKTYTSFRMKDHKLVYCEICLSKKDAQDREGQLKTGFGRGYLRKRLKDYLMPS
jgi:putative endonuclease